jgi:uncharacterized glyoxalase superfamily protein PhnB
MVLDKENIPEGHNTASMFVIVKDGADKFIKFVENVFGGRERTAVRTPDRDGTLIHAEVQVGNTTIMVADSKPDWPFTPAFIQIYVKDAQQILDRAKAEGASIVTEVSTFYNGFNLARLQDAWGNLWWLYEPDVKKPDMEQKSDTSWHEKKPSEVYATLIDVMRSYKTWNK